MTKKTKKAKRIQKAERLERQAKIASVSGKAIACAGSLPGASDIWDTINMLEVSGTFADDPAAAKLRPLLVAAYALRAELERVEVAS